MVDNRDPLLEITSAFDFSRDQAAHEKAQQEIFDLRQTEIKIGENKLNPENTAKFTNNTRTGKYTETEQKRKDRKSHEHHMLMVTLEQLRENLQALEAELVEKYGEDFAENLAAELLDEKAYTEIMLISDQEERRHRIAIEINRGVENGTINPESFDQFEDIKNWLNKREEIEDKMLHMSDAELVDTLKASTDIDQNAEFESHASLESGLDKLF